jgi:serine palmitoyltransferase
LYSEGSSATSSAIPAFAKKGDLLLVDEAVHEPILTGINLSRATIQFFRHNDMADLQSMLETIAKDDRRLKRDSTQQRRFIVVEGLYRNVGDICPLKEILALRKKYCYRVIIDESSSFGVLGKSGRGISEHFGVDVSELDIATLSLDTSLASNGSLCIGTRAVVDHQRLSGAGYCFSASAPPFLSATAIKSLAIMREQPDLLATLHHNAELLHSGLSKIKNLKLKVDSPGVIIHLTLTTPFESVESDALKIHELVQLCIQGGVGVVTSKFSLTRVSDSANELLRPSIMLCSSASYSKTQVNKIVSVITAAAKKLKA